MATIPARREPPPFRLVEVRRVARRSPWMLRLTVGGADLAGLDPGLPAASVRLLVPSPGAVDLVVPTWTGNEFLLPDGHRPVIRTYTPLGFDSEALELDLDVVLHDTGAVAAWAEAAAPGTPAALSGTGRGYSIDPGARSFLLAGDETALPAIGQLLPLLPGGATVQVVVEVAHPDARIELAGHPAAHILWVDLPPGAAPGDALVEAVTRTDVAPDTHVWVAGEAAAVHRIRRHLADNRRVPRRQAHVRGYWKHGRAGTGTDIDTDGESGEL